MNDTDCWQSGAPNGGQVAASSYTLPALMFVAQPAIIRGPESSRIASSPPLLKEGGSFTGLTVIVTVAIFDGALMSAGGFRPLHLPARIRYVNVSVPKKFGAGV